MYTAPALLLDPAWHPFIACLFARLNTGLLLYTLLVCQESCQRLGTRVPLLSPQCFLTYRLSATSLKLGFEPEVPAQTDGQEIWQESCAYDPEPKAGAAGLQVWERAACCSLRQKSRAAGSRLHAGCRFPKQSAPWAVHRRAAAQKLFRVDEMCLRAA